MKGNVGFASPCKMKGNVGSKLHPEMDTLVKQWLYRMQTPCSGADDVYRYLTQVLQRMWNKRSTVLQEEIEKNKVVCRRNSESQKKRGPKHDILRDHRQSELATVGKTGGILWAAYHVVIHIINSILCNYLYNPIYTYIVWFIVYIMIRLYTLQRWSGLLLVVLTATHHENILRIVRGITCPT